MKEIERGNPSYKIESYPSLSSCIEKSFYEMVNQGIPLFLVSVHRLGNGLMFLMGGKILLRIYQGRMLERC